MLSKHKLAIVIPAYKAEFFKETIDSIASQSCKDFTLYIGDDASPYDFEEVIKDYKEKINIVYRRFGENLGGKDLVAQWNRCIDLTQNEDWIWFFSDDDIMGSNCVELFYKHIEEFSNDCLLHFNVQVITENNSLKYKKKDFPPDLSASDFFYQRIKDQISSFGVEYIFKKEAFEKVGRFQSFDLAWSSDNATWMKLATFNGIKTIEGAYVKWRYSNSNLSSIKEDKKIVIRKINANVKFLTWVILFFEQNKLKDRTSGMRKILWFLPIIADTYSLGLSEKYQLINRSLRNLSLKKYTFGALLFWGYKETVKRLKNSIPLKEGFRS